MISFPLAVILAICTTIGYPSEAHSESLEGANRLHTQQQLREFRELESETGLSKASIALADGSFNPGMIIGAIEGLILPAGILGPAWWEWKRRAKEEEYRKNPETPDAKKYFAAEAARLEEIRRRTKASKEKRESKRPDQTRSSFFSRNAKTRTED